MTKNCLTCNQPFDVYHNKDKFCSLKCYKIHHNEYMYKYYAEHKSNWKDYNKINWNKEHPEQCLEYHKKYNKNRLKTDINFKLRTYLANRIYQAIRGINKTQPTVELLGCSIEYFKYYLEKQFKSGMSWSNYGKWHVDHIRQCCTFDLSKKSEQSECFNYKNLRPLWAKENQERPRT